MTVPYSKEHKQKTRQRILDSAGHLFPRKGYEAVSIDDLMQHAGLTRGAFYHHFKDKADVYAEAIVGAALKSPLATTQPEDDPQAWLATIVDAYLSREHIDNTPIPCPLAFLATDIGNRHSNARKAYTRVYEGLVNTLASQLKDDESEKPDDIALAVSALMIGGVVIGRALDKPGTADELLDSCRRTAKQLLQATES